MTKKELELLVKQQAEQITILTQQLMQERMRNSQPPILPMTPSAPSPAIPIDPWRRTTPDCPPPWWGRVICMAGLQ